MLRYVPEKTRKDVASSSESSASLPALSESALERVTVTDVQWFSCGSSVRFHNPHVGHVFIFFFVHYVSYLVTGLFKPPAILGRE